MSASILKYGQIIRFCSYEAAMANPKVNNTFITSKSYTDQNLYFQVYNLDDVYYKEMNNETLNIHNYRESLFQVLPTSSFEINDEMNDKGEKKELQRAKTEEEQFKAMISEKRGKYISFGDRVVLKHVDSQYYISGSIDCAPSGIGAFKIRLRKQLSQKNVFQLMSYRTYEKEGDEISINAPFRIYHCETQCYVSYCFENLFVDKQFFSTDPFRAEIMEKFVEYPLIKNSHYITDLDNQRGYGNEDEKDAATSAITFPVAGRFEIINENIPKRVFKMVLHNEFEMKPVKQAIKNHDIVYFIHTKDDKYLCCSNFKRSSKSDIFLKKRKNQTDLDHIFDGLWEIEEIKIVDEKGDKHDEGLGKTRSPNPKKSQLGMSLSPSINIQGAKFGGGLLNVGDHAFLAQTVIPHLQTGALGVGVIPDEQETTTKSKSKKKYIIRHLISGRIMFITENLMVKVETPSNQRIQKTVLLQSVDSNFSDGALVQFAHKATDRDEKGNQKIVKYFLQIEEDQKDSRLSRQGNDEMNQIQQREEEFLSEENSQTMGDKENADQIEMTYNSFFEINELKMTVDSSQHGFRIYKIDEEIKQLALFVLSSQEILYKFCLSMSRLRLLGEGFGLNRRNTNQDELRKEFEDDTNVAVLNNAINVLKDLIGFIYDCEYSKIAQSGNNPNSKKQRIFDELGMIELLTKMVEIIDRYDELLQMVVPVDRSEYKKVRNIYVLAYNLLESIAANNYIQKIKISKYLEKYLDQLKKQENKVVYRSIQEVLDGNYLALQKKVSEEYIDELIKKFQIQNPDPADLYFLSRLCLCGDKTVIQNQNAIYNSFYRTNEQRKVGFEEETVADNKFKFREDQGKMQILSKIANFPPQYRTLSELYDECILLASDEGNSSNSQKGHWNYFLQYLNLLADICVDRNATPLQYILDNLPLKTLVAFLHESTVKKKLLFQPFIRLVHHAFVETKKFEEINRITKVKEWDSLGNFDIPRSSKYRQIENDIQRTMLLIMEYIRRINKKEFTLPQTKEQQEKMKSKNILDRTNEREPETIDFDPQNKERLYNVKTFLEILKSTLNLGFWPSMDLMKKMVPYMLKVMKFDFEYAEKKLILAGEFAEKDKVYQMVKQELTLNKPNIVLMVECKILAAQILNIIIDYQYNVRVSIITKYFKDVMQNDVDLSKYKFDAIEFAKKWKSNQEYEFIEPTNDKQGYLLDQQLWKDKVNEIISERNIFQLCDSENISESLSMFETFIYENQHLTNMTFEILKRITNERREILKTFKDIIFVAGGNLSNLAKRGVTVTRSVLLHLTSVTIKKESITSTPNHLWEVVRSDGRELMVNREMKPLGAIQELAFLTMAMMKNSNPTLERASRFYKDHQLYPFKELMKAQYDEVNHFEDGSYLVITQKDENLPLNQNLIKSQDHHLLIIDFIKIMSDIKQDEEKDEMRPLPKRALHAAYNFLTVLIWNHNENKKQLQDLLRISECHLKFNVGTIDFYKEMYKNNMKLVKKSEISRIVHHIIDLTNNTDIKLYQKSKLLDFLRVIVIFDDQGYDVNQNIVMEIISQYQVSSKNQIVILKTEDELSNRIRLNYDRWIKDYQDSYFVATRTYADLNVSPELFYLATFFQIFSALIENQNVVNIGKCTNMHPLPFLLDTLKGAHHCWPLIRHLRAYVNKLYYFEGREKDTSLFDAFVKDDLPIIRNQLRGIVQLICNTPDYNIIRIKNPIRYAFMSSYVFLTLEEILHSLNLMFSNKDFSSHMAMLMSQITVGNPEHAHTLLEIIEMDEYLQKTIDGRYINKYLEKVSRKLKKNVANIHLSIVEKFQEKSKTEMADNMKENSFGGDDVPFKKNYIFHQEKGLWRHFIDWNSFKEQDYRRQKLMDSIQKGIIKDPAQSKEAELQKKRDYNLDLIYLGNIEKKIQKVKAQKPISLSQAAEEVKNEQKPLVETNLPKNLTTSMSNRFKVKNQRFENGQIKNTVINNRRKKLVKFIEINEEFTSFANEQTESKLYDIFANLNEISRQKYNNPMVGNADVIKAIVKMNENDPNFIKPEYKLMVVELLTNYIQREASNVFRQNIQEWEVTGEQREKVNAAQNFLSECGCAKFLCSLIVNDLRKDIKMGNSILKFGISLLLGQNKDNQFAIFEILKQDDQNVLIIELQNLIKSCGTSMATHVFGKAQKQITSRMNYSDTYDFYNDTDKSMTRKFIYVPETVEEQKEFELKLIALQEIFIFLRVLCEGNNEIKNFIREQTTNDEEKKVKNESVNFISLGVYEIKRMFVKFNINNVKVPFSIINFIIQVTQIPCISNQLFLCESSFFHDFANLQIEIQNQLIGQRFPASKQNIKVINKLYSLCINNVISCLEGNKRKIYNFLSSEDLSRFFVKCLSFYVKYLPLLEEKLSLKEIKEAKDLEMILAKNRLHENYFLDLFQVISVIIKLMQKLNGNFKKQFEDGIAWNLKLTNMRDHFQLIRKNLLGIEIAMDEYQVSVQDKAQDRAQQRNQILFFPRHAVYSYLSRSTRARIMQEINRSTQRDKIIGLFMTTHEISEEINYNYELDNEYTIGNVPVSISNEKITFYQNLGMYVAAFICFLMICFSSVIYYPYEHAIEYDMGPETTLLKIVSFVQFLVAIIFFLLFLKNHLKLAMGKYEKVREAEEEEGVGLSTLLKLIFKIPFAKEIYCLLNFDQEFMRVCMYMTGSVLGCFYRTECFSILLFNLMLQKMNVLKNILIAITTNMRMLGMLSLLGMAFISIFSIFSIQFYAQTLYPQAIPKQHCESLFNCIIELYIREQIGEDMESFESGRFISDMAYTIFMEMLFSNIVGGVLIDTFAELREKGDQIDEDKKGKCFICGIEKETLEKTNEDLKTHYHSKYHQLWSYVFYIYYLNKKVKKTGLEIIIEDKIKSENVSWIPNSASDSSDISEKIQELEKLITEQREMLKKIQAPQ